MDAPSASASTIPMQSPTEHHRRLGVSAAAPSTTARRNQQPNHSINHLLTQQLENAKMNVLNSKLCNSTTVINPSRVICLRSRFARRRNPRPAAGASSAASVGAFVLGTIVGSVLSLVARFDSAHVMGTVPSLRARVRSSRARVRSSRARVRSSRAHLHAIHPHSPERVATPPASPSLRLYRAQHAACVGPPTTSPTRIPCTNVCTLFIDPTVSPSSLLYGSYRRGNPTPFPKKKLSEAASSPDGGGGVGLLGGFRNDTFC